MERRPYSVKSTANDNIVEKISIYKKYSEAHPAPKPPEGNFAVTPYYDYEELRDKLIEFIPLARMLAENSASEHKVQAENRPEGIMIRCRCCGKFLIRKVIDRNSVVQRNVKKLEMHVSRKLILTEKPRKRLKNKRKKPRSQNDLVVHYKIFFTVPFLWIVLVFARLRYFQQVRNY